MAGRRGQAMVSGILGMNFYVNDPWPPGRAQQDMRKFEVFEQRVTNLASRELAQPAPRSSTSVCGPSVT